MAVFYFWSCLRTGLPGSTAIRKCFLSDRWAIVQEVGLLAGVRKWLFISPLIPWLSQVVIASPAGTESEKRRCSYYSARRLIRCFYQATEALRLLSFCLLILFFGALPYSYIVYRDKLPTLLIIGISFFTMLVIAIHFTVLHRRFCPQDKGERYKHILFALTMPWHAMRLCDDLMQGTHLTKLDPLLLTAFASTRESRKVLGRLYRDSLYKPDSAYRCEVIESVLHAAEISTSELLVPPASEHSADAHYCPCCYHFYTEAVKQCAECGGVDLMKSNAKKPMPSK